MEHQSIPRFPAWRIAAVIVSGILGLRGNQEWMGGLGPILLRTGKISRKFQQAHGERLLHQGGTRIQNDSAVRCRDTFEDRQHQGSPGEIVDGEQGRLELGFRGALTNPPIAGPEVRTMNTLNTCAVHGRGQLIPDPGQGLGDHHSARPRLHPGSEKRK